MVYVSPKRMRGQALVMFLGFAAAMIGVMLIAFNSGQVTNAKMRAMNAADAAAYSGALWQARSLNFQAYMNRAIVVNEVTIAQSVSLRSWVDYLHRLTTNLSMVTKWIPWVNTATTAIDKAVEAVDKTVSGILPGIEMGTRFISWSQHAVLQNGFHVGGAVGAIDIAYDVAKKNGAKVTLGGDALMAKNTVAWFAFTDTYTSAHRAGTSGDGRKRLRQVTLDSRDGFTENRKHEISFLKLIEFRKQGGTDLVGFDAWKGMDSSGLCTSSLIKSTVCVPMGWGGAQAYNPRVVYGLGKHGDGVWDNVKKRPDGTMAAAEANSKSQAIRLPQKFPDYRDLKDLNTSRSERQKISFAVEVMIADKNVPTANSAFNAKAALTDGTSIEHDPQYGPADAGVYGVSEACVYFERPHGAARTDNRFKHKPSNELPSLFNPYWHASLATPSADTRKIVGAFKKLVPVDAFFGGTGSCA